MKNKSIFIILIIILLSFFTGYFSNPFIKDFILKLKGKNYQYTENLNPKTNSNTLFQNKEALDHNLITI